MHRILSSDRIGPDERAAAEVLLGRPLGLNETLTIRTQRLHDAPVGEERARAADALRQTMKRMGEKAAHIPDQEMERLIDEAQDDVRRERS